MAVESNDHIMLHCEQWLDLLDELNIGAFTVNFQHRITAINYSAQALIGLRVNEVLGQDCREVFTGVPCMVSCIVSPKPGQAGGEPVVELFDEDHSRYLITRLATPIYDQAQQVVGCLTILQDHSPISDLIDRVHYEERSLKHILDSLDIGIFTVNRGGLITFFNKAAERISGYDRREVLGRPCSMIFAGSEALDVCLLKGSMADGGLRQSGKGRIVDREGISVPIRAKYLALKNEKGVTVGGLATFHDLTLVHQLNQAIQARYTFHDMIGKSPAMQRIFNRVETVARSDATVLIEGPTGTGKDLLAKVLHSVGPRAGKPWVKVNCAALPDTLLESEFFGYVKGAFTGASRDKPGRFQEADRGTIFLDEIGDLPLSMQAKLLRAIEDKEFYPLGSRHTRKVDVRIISATNRDLERLVANGLFRQDLFYRLNVLRFELPALKERPSDLPLLIRHISRRLCAARGAPPPAIDKETLQILLNHDYPGNVRELENILEHGLIVCQGETIQPQHLPEYLLNQRGALQRPLRADDGHAAERQRLRKALDHCHWHRARTARSLGIDRTTLWRKMKRLGLLS
jgi:PAS domain S-box-containing protein